MVAGHVGWGRREASTDSTKKRAAEKKALAGYDWIDVSGPDGYSGLAAVLDEVFEPEAISTRLEAEVTDAVKSVLVEHGYVDKDYRSTLYGFYSKKGRTYRRDCVRLHFFNGSVKYDESHTDIACDDGSPGDHYFGYIVLRPTMTATLGRSRAGTWDTRGGAWQGDPVGTPGERAWAYSSDLGVSLNGAACGHRGLCARILLGDPPVLQREIPAVSGVSDTGHG